MTVRTHTPHLLARAGTVSALTLATLGGTTLAPGTAPDAEAASLAVRALRIAASKQGSPYEYGAQGPHSFDCSGLTLYSYKRAGRDLPRSAAAQYGHTRHVSAPSRKRGDLVFFSSGSGIYHVGIYAGGGQIWHAPKTGAVVRLDKIWSGTVRYGRVR
ncbi:C40 family peptidase [Streptomyces sp. NPDC001339]|uniref:C40 family peptidase n=1 Tax=Streptomyces sp. NPDC001339 TaxID=3364563 RepID=UPI00369AA79C